MDDDRTELEGIALVTAMEEVTSGIAHALNQPLSAISLYARGSIRRVESGKSLSEEELKSTLESIAEQAMRAGRILRHARDRSKFSLPQRIDANLSEALAPTVAEWSEATHEVGIEFRSNFSKDVPSVRIHPVQIQHAVSQILRNAVEAATNSNAMPPWISLESRQVDGCAQLRITDSGRAEACEDLEALFEPFVGNKEGHLGLGLGICRSIFRMHGGYAMAERNNGRVDWVLTLPGREP